MGTEKQPKVNIILAVYNGQEHLIKQLESISGQTYENIDVYIRDDGSTDNTVQVVQNYIKEDNSNKKFILIHSDGKNLKCPGSFYEILKKCEPAKYYSFCDQDDYWYPEKIQWAVEALEKEDNSKILTYYSACDYKQEDGTFIRKSPAQKESIKLIDVMYYTPGSGFTMVFNDEARQRLVLEPVLGDELHDRWILRGTACFGKAIYDSRSTAAHIRHKNAVTSGDADNKSLIKQFINQELKGDAAMKDKMALCYFYDCFRNKLSKKEREQLELFTRKNNIITWIKKVFYPRRLRRRFAGEIALRMLFFMGRI